MTQKTALVTVAARGIGLATVKQFLTEGRKVAMIDRDGEALLEEAGKLEDVLPVICDVSKPEQVATMMAECADDLGRIDALVNNAGVADFGPIENTTFARWREVMETNLDGVFLCAQAAIPHLRQTGGAIVNVA